MAYPKLILYKLGLRNKIVNKTSHKTIFKSLKFMLPPSRAKSRQLPERRITCEKPFRVFPLQREACRYNRLFRAVLGKCPRNNAVVSALHVEPSIVGLAVQKPV